MVLFVSAFGYQKLLWTTKRLAFHVIFVRIVFLLKLFKNEHEYRIGRTIVIVGIHHFLCHKSYELLHLSPHIILTTRFFLKSNSHRNSLEISETNRPNSSE
jgi:hypothetical protein